MIYTTFAPAASPQPVPPAPAPYTEEQLREMYKVAFAAKDWAAIGRIADYFNQIALNQEYAERLLSGKI